MTTEKNKPTPNKQYRLTGGTGEKCIANGNSWAESEVPTYKITLEEVLKTHPNKEKILKDIKKLKK